jgi:hypothetical protein
MRDGGKGDRKRPLVVSEEQFNNNWDAIFKKKPKIVEMLEVMQSPDNIWFQQAKKHKEEK